MDTGIAGKTVAVLATDGFEDSELREPVAALREAGAEVHVIAPKAGSVRAWKSKDWAEEVAVDRTVDDARPDEYDGLVLPGGVINADHLRVNASAVAFVRHFFEADKPVAVICHAPWLIIEAGAAKARTLTSYPTLRTDLENAGATWLDREVVVDRGLVTSRKPDDLDAFNREFIKLLAAARSSQTAA